MKKLRCPNGCESKEFYCMAIESVYWYVDESQNYVKTEFHKSLDMDDEYFCDECYSAAVLVKK